MATNWPVWSNQLEKGLAILTARLFESLLVTVMVRLYTGTFFLVEVVMEIYRERHVSGGSISFHVRMTRTREAIPFRRTGQRPHTQSPSHGQ